MMKQFALLLLIGCLSSTAIAGEDGNGLYGTWKPLVYIIDGVEYPLSGVMIITPGYFSANTIFNLSEDTPPEANANAGPYKIEGNKIIIEQWMRLHWRPTKTYDSEEHFLTQGLVEVIPFEVKGNQLIFVFPTGNKYISERIPE